MLLRPAPTPSIKTTSSSAAPITASGSGLSIVLSCDGGVAASRAASHSGKTPYSLSDPLALYGRCLGRATSAPFEDSSPAAAGCWAAALGGLFIPGTWLNGSVAALG